MRHLPGTLPLQVGAAFVILTLALAWGRQEQVDMTGTGPAWRARNTYPERTVDWTSPASARHQADPAWCELADGRLLLVHRETETGQGDRWHALTFRSDQPSAPEDAGHVPEEPGAYFPPVLTATADGRALLTWVALRDGRGTLQASTWSEGTWSPPRVLRETAQPVMAHSALLRQDQDLVVAWQEFVPSTSADRRGRYQLFLSSVTDDTLGPPLACRPDTRFDDRDPVLAETGDGTLWLVFCRDLGGDREVMARTVDPDAGTVGPAHNVSLDAWSDDLHPHATAGSGSRLWVVFDSIAMKGRGASTAFVEEPELPNRNQVRLLVLDGDRRLVPERFATAGGVIPTEVPLSQAGGHPRLARSNDNAVHLFLRAHWSGARRTFDYPLVHQRVSIWAPTALFPGSVGSTPPAAVCVTKAGVWVAAEAGQAKNANSYTQELRALGDQGVCLTNRPNPSVLQVAFLANEGTALPVPSLVPAVERGPTTRPQPLPAPDSDPITLGDTHHQIQQGDTTWNVYWGDLHRHSHVSPCTNGFEPGPQDRYWSARQMARNDFFALTDHTSAMTPEEWWHLSKLVDLHQAPDFVTLQGYEWNSPDEGHVNVILKERRDQILCNTHPRGTSLSALGRNLDPAQALTIPHTTASQAITVDWDSYPEALLRVVEVYQAQRGSYEFGGCYLQARNAVRDGSFVQDGLAAGRTFGLIASTDHGNGAAYTAVLARELTRDAIFEALQARRTYAATSKGMLLDFRVGGRLMGRRATADGPLTVDVHVQGTAELAEVVVFRNGEVWQAEGRSGRSPEAEGVLTLELELPEDPAHLVGQAIQLSFPERGRFSPTLRGKLRDHDPARPVSAWRARERRTVVYHVGAGPTGPLARRVRLHGTDDSPVELRIGDGAPQQTTLGQLRLGTWSSPDTNPGVLLAPYGGADALVDPANGMGADTWTAQYTDQDVPPGDSWYYVRVIQTDGEAAWSSPVFVRRS